MKKGNDFSFVVTILFIVAILIPSVSQSRFISIDTKASAYPNVSPYVYSLNNPVKYIDPDGNVVMRSPMMDQKIQRISEKSPILGFIVDVLTDPSGAALEPAAIVSASKSVVKQAARQASESASDVTKSYQTYTKPDKATGDVLSGRTSGKGTPKENVKLRDNKYSKSYDNFGPAELDKSSTNPEAIRGREQQLIDHYGRAKSEGGTAPNKIRGVSRRNPNAQKYSEAANREFKKLPDED